MIERGKIETAQETASFHSDFEFQVSDLLRASDFGFVSYFGFRISTFKV